MLKEVKNNVYNALCLAGATTRSAAITKAIPWPPSLTVKRVTAFT